LSISDNQWITVAPTEFPHEQDAFDFIKSRASGVIGAWSNFEFVEPRGKVYEIDLMLLTLTELILVEIKSWSGILDGTANNMVRYFRGNPHPTPVNNPLLLLNKKAKILQSMLKAQKAGQRLYVPYVESVVFFNNHNLELRIPPEHRPRVYYRDELIEAIRPKEVDLQNPRKRFDKPRVTALNQAFRQLGIRRPSARTLKVGEWLIKELLEDGELYQDHLAQHQSIGETYRRVRTFSVPDNGSKHQRELARRAAQREFKLTDHLQHPGVLKPWELKEHELGPALVFPYEPKAVRLDQFLATQDARLGQEERLEIIRQILDVLRYAHARKVFHRGLAPQSILVMERGRDLEVQIMDWQTGMEQDVTTGTSHISELMTSGARAYMAPEAFHQPGNASGSAADIFSFGAVAFHVLTGRPPAETQLELYQKLQEYPGLRLSSVTDGLSSNLESLVERCTHPMVLERPADIQQVLDLFDAATCPGQDDAVEVVNPLEAQAGDILPGGFLVVRRLGKGGMALALEVVRDEVSYVLKVAHDPDRTEVMLREAEALKALSHPYIVECYDVVEIGNRSCLVIQKAGDETLARRLTERGPLQLDYLERFGKDLLKAVAHLEEKGVRHRDIKPANLGITLHKKDSAAHLMLFDFSLAGVGDDNIDAGTRDYIDPFLINRKPPRWDQSSERYSAAVTLHEMATGVLPRWGDGKSMPGLDPNANLVLESERFDPAVREPLTTFFTRALAREREARFHNAEEMLKAWAEVFQEDFADSGLGQADEAELSELLESSDLETTLASLALGARALRALEHLGVHTIRDLLGLPGGTLHTAAGVGNQTRKRLVELQAVVGERFGDELLEEQDIEAEDHGLLEAFLVPVLGVDTDPDEELKKSYLGLTLPRGVHDWPTLSAVSKERDLEHLSLAKRVPAWRVKWGKLPSLKFLRDEIEQLLNENGGVIVTSEVALGLLSRHGSFSNDRSRRMQLAFALTRAAVEAEQTAGAPRFLWRRIGPTPVIAQREEQMQYLTRLAQVADRCARHEPLLAPSRARDEIRAVEAPESAKGLSPHRLLRLSAACSERAAVSSREEFYPRGMEAERALLLAHGALLGHGELPPEEIQERVFTRYPESEPLPSRPHLDEILQRVDPDLIWSDGEQAYVRRLAIYQTSGASSLHQRYPTTSETPTSSTNPLVAEARAFEERLQRATVEKDFLVLTVTPKRLAQAESEILARFGHTRRDLNQLLLRAMKEKVAENPKARWDKFLEADAEGEGKGWRILTSRLVPDALGQLQDVLFSCKEPQLLVNPSLLARYHQLGILEQMRDQAGRKDGLPAVWMLLPSEDTSRAPTIEGEPVPLLHGGQRARVPDGWLANAHRTAKEKLAT